MDNDAQWVPTIQLIRRKRPRSPESNVSPYANLAQSYFEKLPHLMVLPGLAELLATQRQRHGNVATEKRSDGPSIASIQNQPEASIQLQLNESEVEDKTPWPSAKQYFNIFLTLQSEFKIPVYDFGVDSRGVPLHPEFIYSQPVSCMYFLKCSRLLGKGSFGFPRKRKVSSEMAPRSIGANTEGKKESSKDFEWRKMSFVTGLPKKLPIVRYITATCFSRPTYVSAKKKVFRMHAVMLADKTGRNEIGEFVLVHIRAGGCKRAGFRACVANCASSWAPDSVMADHEADVMAVRGPVSRTALPCLHT